MIYKIQRNTMGMWSNLPKVKPIKTDYDKSTQQI